MNDEMKELLESFRKGNVPMLQFMKSMKELKERTGEPEHDIRLGKAVVAGRHRHTEGRDLMTIILEAYGFRTVVVERDSSVIDIVDLCMDPEVTVLCMSIQTTYDIPDLKEAVELMTENGIRDRIVFNAGGVAISERVSQEIGCDVFERTAVDSAESISEEVLRRSSVL